MINRVLLVGRLTRDPELRSTNSGKKVTSVTIAIDNLTKDAEGNRTSSFIPVTAWNGSAEIICKYTRKGSLVGVDGRLVQRSYSRKDGTNASVLEVIADSITLLDSKSSASNRNDDSGYEADADNSISDLESADLADDDLPF